MVGGELMVAAPFQEKTFQRWIDLLLMLLAGWQSLLSKLVSASVFLCRLVLISYHSGIDGENFDLQSHSCED